MVASASHISEEDRGLNVREGERLYVVERCTMDWWFVRKRATQEEGLVKSDILVTPEEYTLILQAKEHVDTAEAELSVVLQYPTFIETMEEIIRVKEGECVTFRFKVVANPPPQISWFKESTRIESSSRYQITITEDYICTLVIKEALLEDSATFNFVAENHLGLCSQTVQLDVEGKLI